jgi:hypothetical protein
MYPLFYRGCVALYEVRAEIWAVDNTASRGLKWDHTTQGAFFLHSTMTVSAKATRVMHATICMLFFTFRRSCWMAHFCVPGGQPSLNILSDVISFQSGFSVSFIFCFFRFYYSPRLSRASNAPFA